ncbi:MAG: glutamate synthase subunit beta [Epsilonproteobacteria bacterium]|nr:glutamate synthase subunit beta [Campylobacterota bacterium]
MQNFVNLERIEPKKRSSNERKKDFNEIYEVFNPDEASAQADRCIQCGDPYCHNKCPLHNFIPFWLKSVAEKDLELSFKISNESNPFPEITGRVCPQDRLCEGACTLNDGYGAVTIGSIELFISEEAFKKGIKPSFKPLITDKRVAVIGSGPAGFSAATYLLRNGIGVDMYEKAPKPGGLLTFGIPNFKLDKEVVFRRFRWLEEAGMKLFLNTEVGKDISFEELLNKYEAVFIGIGAEKSKRAGIENEDAEGTFLAIEFLRNIQNKLFNLPHDSKYNVEGKDVVIIGGGDTAMDCIRTSIRENAKSVKCLYRRDEENMPGSKKEYKNALEEGAEFVFNVSPKRIIVDEKGRVKAIEMQRTELGERDESGRRRMRVIEGSEFVVDADVVIFALGFDPAVPSFLKENGIEVNDWGGIVIDENYETSKERVFSGGDCYRGSDLVVTAAYDGREAAKHIVEKYFK